MRTMRVITHSEAETARAGETLARRLAPGSVVLLHGDLGAGKTCFVRGMATGIGADPDDVSSPTFTLVQEYRGRTTLYHVDLYRIAPGEADDLGLEEMAATGIVAIEWAEKLLTAPADATVVHIAEAGEDAREIEITDGKA